MRCGYGKVNAGMCVQVLADLFNVSHIINIGVAGSLLNHLPFVIIRAISDKADDSAGEMDFPTFKKQAAENCAKMTVEFVKNFEMGENHFKEAFSFKNY